MGQPNDLLTQSGTKTESYKNFVKIVFLVYILRYSLQLLEFQFGMPGRNISTLLNLIYFENLFRDIGFSSSYCFVPVYLSF